MRPTETLRMAVASLMANRLRSSLTMLGMVIGNASVIAMVGVGQGVERLAAQQFEALGPNVLFVSPGNADARTSTTDQPKTLVLEDAEAIAQQVPSIQAVAPQNQSRSLITYRSQSTYTSITGTTPAFLVVRSFDVDRGRFITDQDVNRNAQVTALGPELATKLFGTSDPIGQSVRIKSVSFQVVGVMKAKGSSLGTNNDDAAYIPITTMASRVVGQTSPYGLQVSSIAVSAKDQESAGAAEFQITNLLRLRHRISGEDDFSVRAQQDILNIVNTITGGLTILLAAISGISLLIGGIGIMNIMLVSVTERTQEIGLRKAVGASETDILTQFLIEAIILSIAGGSVGAATGVGSTLLIGLLTPVQTGLSLVTVTLALGVSGSIGLFFGVLPARRAARLDPIVALRST